MIAKAGIDLDAIRTTIDLDDVAVGTVLGIVFGRHGLVAKAEGNVVYVTTKADALGPPVLVLHPISHLTWQKTDFHGPDIDLYPSDFTPPERVDESPVEDDPFLDPQHVVDLVKEMVDAAWETEGWSLRATKQFLPPLDEGSILFMPVTTPGISIEEAKKLVERQDKILRSFPEVQSVFGKAGRAETPTDPAPLSIIETVVVLNPQDKWRPGMTLEDLTDEMNRALAFGGVQNAFTMPIKARIDMLTTGIRTPIGIKIFGKDLVEIAAIGERLENVLKMVPGTRSVYAEREMGGYFIDFIPDREAIARYGHLRAVKSVSGKMRLVRPIRSGGTSKGEPRSLPGTSWDHLTHQTNHAGPTSQPTGAVHVCVC